MPAQTLEQPPRTLSASFLKASPETASATAAPMPSFYMPEPAADWTEKPYEWEISRLPLGAIVLASVAFWAALGCAVWLV